MAYRVNIAIGKGKNLTTSSSIPLANKIKVRNWLKKSSIGNYKTNISVENLKTKKIYYGRKIHFYNPKWW